MENATTLHHSPLIADLENELKDTRSRVRKYHQTLTGAEILSTSQCNRIRQDLHCENQTIDQLQKQLKTLYTK
jgi:hypothetical protein